MRERIINLGKDLVKELGLDPGVDTLSRWMANYIAEKLIIIESSSLEEKTKAEKECFDTILKLWQYRSTYQNGHRPYENFEPIFRVLDRLDPENKQTYFFNNTHATGTKKTNKVSKGVQQWLDIALGIDQIARVWLNYIFKEAALSASDKNTIEWLKNSIDLQNNDDASIIIRVLSENSANKNEIDTESVKQKKRESIISRIKKLEAFNDFNQKLLSIFQQELEDILKDVSLLDKGDMK